ncbi:MAG TPA: peptidase M3, partial [Treponema sp.]|nr:peptidase M3 [Treponema sp.]
KSHYYSPELDFYNFPYAFGQLFATGLYAQSKIQGPSFADTYRQLLSYTVTNSCEEVCKKAGFDITTTDFWQSGIDIYAKEIEMFKAYVEKL